jgi:hypothetical protein
MPTEFASALAKRVLEPQALADIDVIDADLGLSGSSVAQRSGFKELVGRVGLSETRIKPKELQYEAR